MVNSGAGGRQTIAAKDSTMGQLPVEHYLRLLLHHKWWVLGVWLVVSAATVIYSYHLHDVFTSETLILVDPQRVPEAYVKSTVTGDVRNRLGTLSQQILSATRLGTIINDQKLYQEEKKKGMAHEDIITLMRSDISVHVVSDFGGGQDLQAFRIGYSGTDPQLVARVTNQIAELFINTNLEEREKQSTGTTEFLTNELADTRKKLEIQESKLRDFKLKHVGEMPKQETADLQLLGQAQAQLQIEADSLGRAEQQRNYYQSLLGQSAPVVDVDEGEQPGLHASGAKTPHAVKQSVIDTAKLATLLTRYSEKHPDVQALKKQIEEDEAKEAKEAPPAPASADPSTTAASNPAPAAAAVRPVYRPPVSHFNPVLESQLKAVDAEIAKHKEEQQRLSKLVSSYQAKLEAIPYREQEITELERDYEMSKAHYSQLLDKQLSAQTATELEVRQKGEQFKILDYAQPAERPTKPNRIIINTVGCVAGLVLGLLLAIGKDFLSMSIIAPQDIAAAASGLAVLGVIPIIQTRGDRRIRKIMVIISTAFAVVIVLVGSAIVFVHYHPI
jgi:polysaccharide chain length determinant protein (PEP-CTERM system associated)